MPSPGDVNIEELFKFNFSSCIFVFMYLCMDGFFLVAFDPLWSHWMTTSNTQFAIWSDAAANVVCIFYTIIIGGVCMYTLSIGGVCMSTPVLSSFVGLLFLFLVFVLDHPLVKGCKMLYLITHLIATCASQQSYLVTVTLNTNKDIRVFKHTRTILAICGVLFRTFVYAVIDASFMLAFMIGIDTIGCDMMTMWLEPYKQVYTRVVFVKVCQLYIVLSLDRFCKCVEIDTKHDWITFSNSNKGECVYFWLQSLYDNVLVHISDIVKTPWKQTFEFRELTGLNYAGKIIKGFIVICFIFWFFGMVLTIMFSHLSVENLRTQLGDTIARKLSPEFEQFQKNQPKTRNQVDTNWLITFWVIIFDLISSVTTKMWDIGCALTLPHLYITFGSCIVMFFEAHARVCAQMSIFLDMKPLDGARQTRLAVFEMIVGEVTLYERIVTHKHAALWCSLWVLYYIAMATCWSMQSDWIDLYVRIFVQHFCHVFLLVFSGILRIAWNLSTPKTVLVKV